MRKTPTRRALLRSLGRYASLGLLALLAGRLASRRRRPGGGRECINAGICRGCGAFKDCGLPQAAAARRAARMQGS